MTIADIRAASKNLISKVPKDIILVAVLLFVSAASFGFGILVGQDTGSGTPFSVCDSTAVPEVHPETGGEVVASKTGSKYFLPWCAGAKNISEANLITFSSAEEAQTKGYTPAANCKGL